MSAKGAAQPADTQSEHSHFLLGNRSVAIGEDIEYGEGRRKEPIYRGGKEKEFYLWVL